MTLVIELGPADLAAYLSAGVFLLLAGQWIAAARIRYDGQAQRYGIGFALCMGGGLVARAPATLTALNRIGGGPYAGALVGDLLKTAACGLLVLLALALRVRGEPESRSRSQRLIRRHGVAAVTVAVLLAVLLYAAHPAVRDDSLVVSGAGRWLLAGYDAVFGGYAVCCLAVLGGVLRRQIRRSEPGLLRTGLWLMTASAAAGVLWSLWTLDDLIPVLLRGRQDNSEDIPSDVLGAICAAFAVTGATVTAWGATRWGAGITAPVRWLRARRRYLALEPLWSALHTAVPGIALAPRSGRRPPLRTAEFALYRRIIEIRDGQLALRPYLQPQLPEWLAAVEPGAEPHGAELEAAALAAALEARRCGRPGGGAAVAGPGWVPQPVPGTVAAGAAWLLQVAVAFDGSRLVAEVRQRARSAA